MAKNILGCWTLSSQCEPVSPHWFILRQKYLSFAKEKRSETLTLTLTRGNGFSASKKQRRRRFGKPRQGPNASQLSLRHLRHRRRLPRRTGQCRFSPLQFQQLHSHFPNFNYFFHGWRMRVFIVQIVYSISLFWTLHCYLFIYWGSWFRGCRLWITELTRSGSTITLG